MCRHPTAFHRLAKALDVVPYGPAAAGDLGAGTDSTSPGFTLRSAVLLESWPQPHGRNDSTKNELAEKGEAMDGGRWRRWSS